ncbi:MAG: CinA family nicotinamide mononucleotide deamidase-related protein [Elusimicrobiota bacterium]|nr:MAG: CinA family nicotinamide mononucleotide deamidase-related protein [Elusimicrobiota bacterium]
MSAEPPKAYLVCVGSELLSGQVNTHQAWLSVRLRRAGFDVIGESSLPDSVPRIRAALKRALAAADAVIVCGGLGPTFDDITREAAASALGRKLSFRPRLWKVILKRFARYHVAVPEENKRQAEVIDGAEVLPNASGSAPGQRLEFRAGGRARSLILLPGPYSEMSPIFDAVLPRLAARHARGAAAALTVRLAGVPESVADERLDPVRARHPGASFTILASGGEVSFHATARARTAAAARREIAEIREEVLAAVGRWSVGEGDETLEGALGARLRKAGLTLCVAESCTGGLLGARLTSVAGSSAWFNGGVIAYANGVKTRALGVKPSLLARHGAVSKECALAMAEGARKFAASSMAISITGIAGPGGGTKAKPVGTVHVAVSGPGRAASARALLIHGPREQVRSRAASAALVLLKETLDAL